MHLRLEINTNPKGPVIEEFQNGIHLKGDALSYKAKNPEGYQAGDLILTTESTPVYFNMRFKKDRVPHPAPLDILTGIFEGDFDFGYIKHGYQIKEILQQKEGQGLIKMQAVRIDDDNFLVEIKDSAASVIWSVAKLNEYYFVLKSTSFSFALSKGMAFGLPQGAIAVGSSVISAAMKTKNILAICQKLFPVGNDGLRLFRTVTVQAVKLLRSNNFFIMFIRHLSSQLGKALITNRQALIDNYLQQNEKAFNELAYKQIAYSLGAALASTLEKMTAKALKLDKFSKDVNKMFKNSEGNPYVKWFCEEFVLSIMALVKQYTNPFSLFQDYIKRRYGNKPQPKDLYYIKDSFIQDFVNTSLQNSFKRIFDKWASLEFASLRTSAK